MKSEFFASIPNKTALLGIRGFFVSNGELLHPDVVELIILRCVVLYRAELSIQLR